MTAVDSHGPAQLGGPVRQPAQRRRGLRDDSSAATGRHRTWRSNHPTLVEPGPGLSIQLDAAPPGHQLKARRRLQRAHEHGLRLVTPGRHHIKANVHPVDLEDIGMAAHRVHRLGPCRAAARKGVGGAVFGPRVGLDFDDDAGREPVVIDVDELRSQERRCQLQRRPHEKGTRQNVAAVHAGCVDAALEGA